jgi:hypothetical protein
MDCAGAHLVVDSGRRLRETGRNLFLVVVDRGGARVGRPLSAHEHLFARSRLLDAAPTLRSPIADSPGSKPAVARILGRSRTQPSAFAHALALVVAVEHREMVGQAEQCQESVDRAQCRATSPGLGDRRRPRAPPTEPGRRVAAMPGLRRADGHKAGLRRRSGRRSGTSRLCGAQLDEDAARRCDVDQTRHRDHRERCIRDCISPRSISPSTTAPRA